MRSSCFCTIPLALVETTTALNLWAVAIEAATLRQSLKRRQRRRRIMRCKALHNLSTAHFRHTRKCVGQRAAVHCISLKTLASSCLVKSSASTSSRRSNSTELLLRSLRRLLRRTGGSLRCAIRRRQRGGSDNISKR